MNLVLCNLCVALLFGAVQGKTLFFEPNGSTLCPDKEGSCPDGTTCCQLQSGKYGCCPFADAECCSDYLHCCPSGYQCDIPHQQCKREFGGTTDWASKTQLTPIKARSVICPDQQSQCDDGETCCQLSSGQWGCCPYPEAVCCDDHEHCCPNGYTCDVPHQQCLKKNGETLSWSRNGMSTSLEKVSSTVICPDQQSQCGDGETCCQLTSGQWGCCPYPQAVCCDDHEHCCPNSYTCDVPHQQCLKQSGETLSWSRSGPSTSVKKVSATIICPDQQSQCGDGQTCCQLASGQWGCCPYPEAACCDDHEHCCPNGYTCDVPHQQCVKKNGKILSWSRSAPSTSVKKVSVGIICPDQQSQCDDGETCCQLAGGQYGCCPYPQAVCCDDHEHCCPNGYTCDVPHQQCLKQSGETLSWSRNSPSTLVGKVTVGIICPDQQSQCDDGETCCQLASGQYGCCPYPEAVCCDDHEHCCPNGYTCDVPHQQCLKQSGETLSWSRNSPSTSVKKVTVGIICPDQQSQCDDGETCCQLASGQYGCCPYPEAVCCDDHEHCCPNGYTCDVPHQQCLKQNGDTLSWSRNSPSTSVRKVTVGIICPDQQSQCDDGETCCQLASGQYGCCPYPEAVCCDDHEHCCPNGYTCDVPHQQCLKQNGDTLSWSKSGPSTAVNKVSSRIICPDQQSQCDDGETCCQLASGQYGCCPYPQAVCCDDHEHCCPNGYTCDVPHQQCLKQSGETLSWSRNSPSTSVRKVSSQTICPDKKSQCNEGETCCQLSSGDYGCCPFFDAVCCDDHEHCCPSGYTCDIPHQHCNLAGTGKILPWSKKSKATPISTKSKSVVCPDGQSLCPDEQTCCQLESGSWACCPLPKAVCCDDHEHCCPNGYTCDVPAQTCVQQNGDVIRWSKKVAATPIKAKSNVCSDQKSKCQDGSTCCSNPTNGNKGCCPYENAVCCSDGVHCCPSNTQCDNESQMCQSNILMMAVSWHQLDKLIGSGYGLASAKKENVVCPDQESDCPADTTCCQMQSSLYGCCPFKEAICCTDKLHCCPQGFRCDLEHSLCTSENSEVALPWEMFGRRRAKKVVV